MLAFVAGVFGSACGGVIRHEDGAESDAWTRESSSAAEPGADEGDSAELSNKGEGDGAVWSNEELEGGLACDCDPEEEFYVEVFDVRRGKLREYVLPSLWASYDVACVSNVPQVRLGACGTFALTGCDEASNCVALGYDGSILALSLLNEDDSLSTIIAQPYSLSFAQEEGRAFGAALFEDQNGPTYEVEFGVCVTNEEPSCR